MAIVTEIVKMQIQDNISADEFIKIVDHLEREFHTKEPGFMDTELLHDAKENFWYMIQHWRGLEEMKAAAAQMFKSPLTEAFRNAVNPKAISITVLPQLQTW